MKAKAATNSKPQQPQTATKLPRPPTSARGTRWHATFIARLRETANVRLSAEASGVSKDACYAHRKKYPKFADAWAEAISDAVDKLEAFAWARATHGIEEEIWQRDAKGNPVKVGSIRKPSDSLLMFLLKAHRPEVYRESIRQELTGPNGEPLTRAVPAQVQINLVNNGRNAQLVDGKAEPPIASPPIALPPADIEVKPVPKPEPGAKDGGDEEPKQRTRKVAPAVMSGEEFLAGN